jgi:ADP-ribose pyrophosphatase
MPDLAEERISTEELLDGVLLNVHRDTVRLPDDSDAVREWIDHPGAAAVIPIFDDGTTIVIEQHRYAAGKTFLEIPAGKLDHASEDPEDVAARELEEETGWRAGQFTRLGALHPAVGYSNELIHYFLAEDLERGEQNLEEGEFVEVREMPFADVIERAHANKVQDMKSFSGLMMAERHLADR